jgi:hypothetical protein
MRYVTGSITLSRSRDVPLLQQVLHCGFVTHDQLWQFMFHDMVERRDDAFRWRVKRLVEHGFLHRHVLSGKKRSFVYSVTQDGASELTGFEQYCPGTTAFFERKEDRERMRHALDLNDIHLALLRSGALRRWMSEIEVRSRNELTECGYAKDYDAVLTLHIGKDQLQLALEYERYAKGRNRYLEIAAAIQRERRVDVFLYLFPDYELLLFVRGFFERVRCPVYFGIYSEFKRRFLEMKILDVSHSYCSFAVALQKMPLTH